MPKKAEILTDDSPMPWGNKFKDVPMKDVPAYYLVQMHENGLLSAQVDDYVRERIDDLRQDVIK